MTSKIDYKKIADYSYVAHMIWEYIRTIVDELEGKLFFKVTLYADSLLYTFRVMCCRASGDLRQVHLLKINVFRQYISLLNIYEENIKIFKTLKLVHAFEVKMLKEEISAVTEAFGGGKIFEKTLLLYNQQYKKRIREKIIALFTGQSKCRIGIYGLGKQTECLMKFCKQNGIRAKKIIYIDSYEKSGGRYLNGCEIKNIRDVGDDVDKIIISSCLYREEMYDMAKKFLSADKKIVFLYEVDEEEIIWDLL